MARRRSSGARVAACEQLEPRAMLAGITWTYVEDWIHTAPGAPTPTPTFGTSGATNTYDNTDKGVLVLTIDGSVVDNPATPVNEANGTAIFLRVVNGNYIFSSDVFGSNRIVEIPSGYGSGYSLQTKDPDSGATPATPAGFTGYSAEFDTIYVRTANLVDGTDQPSFTIVGASQNIAKSLVVDLTDGGTALSGSKIDIGAPVIVSASAAGGEIGYQGDAATSPESVGGAIYLAAESTAINAAVSSRNNLTLMAAVGADNLANNVVPTGIAINQAVTVPGLVMASVSGTAFNLNAGGSIGNGVNGAAGLVMDLQDAEARIVGTINATDQSYFIMPSALQPADVTARTLTTRSASTSAQTGTLTANQLIIYLANDVPGGVDGKVDLQTAVGNLRITSTPGALLDYGITIQNKTASLLLDAVSASEGDIAISNTGSINLLAAIDTVGGFSLSSAVDLTVASAVQSSSGVSLSSTGGNLATKAAIRTTPVAGTGEITLAAAKDVTVDSLVRADNSSIKITSTAGAIKSGANLALDPTSRVTAPSVILSAATGIDLGTSIRSLEAVVTGAGSLKIDDVDLDEVDPLWPSWGSLIVAEASTASGDVSLETTQSIDVQQLEAGGAGNASVTSTGGSITLGTVIATDNSVTLTAADFDSAGAPLWQGFITGNAPLATEINWTADDVVDGSGLTDASLYRNIPVISAYRLSTGDIAFTADNSTTLKSIKTTDGDVSVFSTAGSIVATSIEAVGLTNNGAVGLAALGGSVTLGGLVADGGVSVLAAQDIVDDGVASTTGVTAATITLSAASSGVVGSIGTAKDRVSVASPGAGVAVVLTVSKALAPDALDAQGVYLTADGSVALNADAVDVVDVRTTGVQSDLDAQSVNATDVDGQIVLAAGRDLVAGTLQAGGAAFGEASSISLQAARGITISAASSMRAETLSLTAGQFPGATDLAGVDDVNHFVVEATGPSALDLRFNRPNDLILDGVKTASGNITIKNDDVGAILIGSGGVTAGTATTANTVTITSKSSIDEYVDPDAGVTGMLGMFSTSATATPAAQPSATMTSGWERVAPLGSRSGATSVVSWQGAAAAAYTDRWVVKASSPTVTAQSLTAGFRSRSATSTWTASSLGEGYYSVVAPRATQAGFLSWANATPGLAFAQPDFVITKSATPNDPSYGQLWGLNNTTNPAADIDAPAAWDVTTGSRSTVVAVIDSGVDYNHPDLAANMWRNPGETPGDGIDNDGNGFVDDIYGWDFANNDANPMDDDDHGTHCAGTIGAVGNNGIGIVGVNWQVSIMALKFLAPGGGSTSAAIASVNYATMMRRDHGVNVVATNNSWGGGAFNQTLKDAIKAGGDAGILFIASAGNTASDNDAVTRYPSGYDEPSIIAVAATDNANNLASFSCFGATSVDVGAPGVGIVSTTPNNTYASFNGTSMAAPHVTGVVALLASAYPKATASQIKSAILSSTVAIPSLAGKVATGGLVNAPAALAALGEMMGGGPITAGGLVTLTAVGDITASTRAGQLSATSGGTIEIAQSGDVKIAGITAATAATLEVTGAVLAGTGTLTAPLATVRATGGIALKTDVTTLSAVSSGGNVTVLEANGLAVGADGIKASGIASITLTAGNLDSSGGVISGSAVGIKLLSAGNLDVDTSASSLTASTAGGDITIRNDKSFNIGAAGILVGDPTKNDISLEVASGGITTGTGSLKADTLALSATTGIVANTSANSLTATSTAGDIAITQAGKALTLTAITASNGGVTVATNDNVAVTNVQALGSGKNVSITATGTTKNITLASGGIVADGDSVTLTASGKIDGKDSATTPDVKAATVTLTAAGGDLDATLQATSVTAKATGNLDILLLGAKTVFLVPTGGVSLAAGGNVTLGTGTNDVVVVTAPTAGTGKTTTYETTGLVTFAVTATAATGAGSLAKAVADASAATVVGGTAGVSFASTVTSPIQLTSTLDITKKLAIDGTRRINVATGTLVTGPMVNIDGSKLGSASTNGLKFTTSGGSTSSNSSLKGLAFYGFSRGAAVEITPTADSADIGGITIQGNLFGTSATGLVSANKIGILAQNAAGGATKTVTGLNILGNTIVRNADTGIRLGAMVSGATVTGNLVGTNSARIALGNGVGIDIVGAGAGNTIGGSSTALANVIANNTTAGVRIQATDASGGTATTIRGNELPQNAIGVHVAGATKSVLIAGNTITRSTLDGVRIADSASAVTVGGALASDRNFIGTTATGASGLGNARNGVSVSSNGTGITIQNNAILGSGTANTANDNAGVKLSGTDAATLLSGNSIRSNRGAGVLALGGARATLTRNTISSNTGSGVHVASGTLVVGGDKTAADTALRQSANTLESNGRYGVEVLAGAFAQVAANSMNVNRLGGILNANAGTAAPVIGTVTRSAASGLLTVNFSGLTVGDVLHVYAGSAQGRVYLGQFLAAAATQTFTMTLAQQTAAGVATSISVGATVTATRITAAGHTSPFAAARTIARA